MRRLVIPMLGAALIASACGSSNPVDNESSASMEALLGGPAAPGSADIDAVVAHVEDFWDDAGPDLGIDFVSLGNRVFAATDLPNDEAVCQGQQITAADTEFNAFAVDCPEGLTIVYDDIELFPELENEYGQVAPAFVLAHEWGHAVQFQGLVDFSALPSVIVEIQADCLSGAWVRHAFESGFEPFTSDAVLNDLLGTVVSFRDAPGSEAEAAGAHGSGFDRVRSFQEGFDGGVEACAEYDDPDRDANITQIGFLDAEDEANEGNLPFEEIVPLVADDLDLFWSPIEDFDSYGDPLEGLDEDLLRDIHEEIGDNAVGVMMSLAYSIQAQEALGAERAGEEAAQQRACLLGLWLGQIGRGQGSFSLSPGDFDEAILTFLELADTQDPTESFELIAAMRDGFVDSADPEANCGLS